MKEKERPANGDENISSFVLRVEYMVDTDQTPQEKIAKYHAFQNLPFQKRRAAFEAMGPREQIEAVLYGLEIEDQETCLSRLGDFDSGPFNGYTQVAAERDHLNAELRYVLKRALEQERK